MLREVRKRKVEQIAFVDFEDEPAYCRACYQTERTETERLFERIKELEAQIEEWAKSIDEELNIINPANTMGLMIVLSQMQGLKDSK